MLEKIRENHIDIVPIIQEELNVVILDCIQDIVKEVYNSIE